MNLVFGSVMMDPENVDHDEKQRRFCKSNQNNYPSGFDGTLNSSAQNPKP
jgi:hypothetical protein